MKRHLASLLILILSAALFAADEHAMLDLAKVQEIAKGATREKFPDADSVHRLPFWPIPPSPFQVRSGKNMSIL